MKGEFIMFFVFWITLYFETFRELRELQEAFWTEYCTNLIFKEANELEV